LNDILKFETINKHSKSRNNYINHPRSIHTLYTKKQKKNQPKKYSNLHYSDIKATNFEIMKHANILNKILRERKTNKAIRY